MEKSKFEVKPTCHECKHSDKLVRNGQVQHGEVVGDMVTICRLNPPIIAYAFMPTAQGQGQIMAHTLWPEMMNGDYCSKLETRAN